MSMTTRQVGVALAVIAAITTGLVLEHRTNTRLATELAGLRAVAADNAGLREENGRLVKQAAELDALRADRAELERLRREAAAAPTRPAAPARPAADIPLAAGLTPVLSLGNAGRATPAAAFATQLWAARTGDIGLETAAITLGPEARAKLQDLAARLPASLVAEYDTPEKLMAFILAGSRHPVGGMQVLGETPQGPDDVTLQTQWQHTDDTLVHQSDVQFHHDPEGWKMVVPVILVDRAAAYLIRSTTTPGGGN